MAKYFAAAQNREMLICGSMASVFSSFLPIGGQSAGQSAGLLKNWFLPVGGTVGGSSQIRMARRPIYPSQIEFLQPGYHIGSDTIKVIAVVDTP